MAEEVSLLRLNDDCLFEVFSWLPMLDLCAVRTTCSRLKSLTESYFSRTYKSLHTDSNSIKSDFGSVKRDEMHQILSAFGNHVETLTMDARNVAGDENDWLRFVNSFCAHHPLKHLKLLRFHFNEDVISEYSHPFQNVEKLTIDKCTNAGMEIAKVIQKCTELQHLALIRNDSIDEICLTKAYPKLRGFSTKSDNNFNQTAIGILFVENKQLTSIEIADCYDSISDDALLDIIPEHLTELEKLTFRPNSISNHSNDKMLDLVKLEKLRELDIGLQTQKNCVSIVDALATKNRLTALGLAFVPSTKDMFEAIGRLTNLEKLKLVFVLDGDASSPAFEKLAAQLVNLKEFYVSTCEFVTLDELIQFIAVAPKLENLMVSACKKIESINEEQFVRLGEVCAKRNVNQILTFHFDEPHMVDVGDETKRKYSEFVRLVALSDDSKDFTAFQKPRNQYFAEEGGAFDYYEDDDYYDDNDGDFDDYELDDDDDDLEFFG